MYKPKLRRFCRSFQVDADQSRIMCNPVGETLLDAPFASRMSGPRHSKQQRPDLGVGNQLVQMEDVRLGDCYIFDRIAGRSSDGRLPI